MRCIKLVLIHPENMTVKEILENNAIYGRIEAFVKVQVAGELQQGRKFILEPGNINA